MNLTELKEWMAEHNETMSKSISGLAKINALRGITNAFYDELIHEQEEYSLYYNHYNNETLLLLKTPLPPGTCWLILNGNHSEQYVKIINGGGYVDDVIRYHQANMLEYKNEFSEDYVFELVEQNKVKYLRGLYNNAKESVI